MAEALEKNRIALERSFSVVRWRVSSSAPDPGDTDGRDPLAPDWWVSEDEASDSSLTAMGIDLSALDAAVLAAAREAED